MYIFIKIVSEKLNHIHSAEYNNKKKTVWVSKKFPPKDFHRRVMRDKAKKVVIKEYYW